MKEDEKQIFETPDVIFSADSEITYEERKRPNITLPGIATLQAIEPIQATPISGNSAIISKSLSDVMTGRKINAREKEELQHKCNEDSLNISIFIDEQGKIKHTLNLPMRKIIHAFSMMCFNEQENRHDTTAHGLLTNYTKTKAAVNKYNAPILKGKINEELATNGAPVNFGCLDLYNIAEEKPKLLQQIAGAFRPEYKGLIDIESLTEQNKQMFLGILSKGLHLIHFTMEELLTDYLGITKGRNYKTYQDAFAEVINIFYCAYDQETQQYIPHRLIRDVQPFMDGHNKVYYLDLSPLFWEGMAKQWKMYPPLDIDRKIIGKADEPTMILYEFIISQMRTNWNGTISFGKLCEMLLKEDIEKGVRIIDIKKKLFGAFQMLFDSKIILNNPIEPLMKDRTRADKLNQMELHIEPNKDIFGRQ